MSKKWKVAEKKKRKSDVEGLDEMFDGLQLYRTMLSPQHHPTPPGRQKLKASRELYRHVNFSSLVQRKHSKLAEYSARFLVSASFSGES